MSTPSDRQDPSEKALVIKAKGGLGNRMLSAVTGLVLARLNNRTPYVDWRDGMYLEVGDNLYPLLFEAGWMGDLAAYDKETDVAPTIWSGRLAQQPVDIIRSEFPDKHQDPLLYRKLSIDLKRADPGSRVGVYWSYIPKLKRLQSRLSRSPHFVGKDLDTITSDMLDKHFTPVKEVRDRVDAIFAETTSPMIGVHIRFTDRKVPIEKILAKLEGLTRRQPEAGIFLATDSAEAQEAILSRFPSAKTIDKALASDDVALHFSSEHFSDPVVEARNALIDMVALSRCNWLVHSRHSTFSVTAALIGRIPDERQIDVDRSNLKVRLKQFVQARV
ncbi:nodulation protein NodZ [Aurantiacibacter poecillastricola]|uniref:nodulation protein NodZ n=1 Tax=Aurantiacibacter poecillastricola TaxID=3064385 RepID=UPI00273F58C6|nr:nodulation protein NodZ [Aurantiacibacter sp. 219JJ12-13]MDP5260704.1 nodulation protein NodZ [Aurantiacibacter sp. 219JJ12-13]